jgi:hypothetical protein
MMSGVLRAFLHLQFFSFPLQKIGMARLPSHSSTFFGTVATCLRALLAVVNIVSFTFLSTCIADISTQIAELFCKLAVHRHQCCRCPTNCSTFPVDLSTACHHFYILLFEVRGGTEFTCFCAAHTGIYTALPFCILKCWSCSRHIPEWYAFYLSSIYSSDRTETV